MSVAFTREEDTEAAAAFLPERPVSPHTNLVTATGLAALETSLAAARVAFAVAQTAGDISTNRAAMANAMRDLRYYANRRASAQLLEPDTQAGIAAFGMTVVVDRSDGRRQRFRIVGEDEADAASGSISYVSPLARAVLGKAVGETATVAGKDVVLVALA